MKRLVSGLLAAMLLAGSAAALEPISQPIATSGYTYYAIQADGALLAWGDSFHGAVGPTDQDPLPWEEANVLLENARYVDAGFVMAAAIDEDGVLWGWGGTHNGRGFGAEEPYRLLEDVVSVSVMDSMCAALRTDGTVWTWGPRSGKSLAEHEDDPFYPPTQVLDHVVKLCGDLAVLEANHDIETLRSGPYPYYLKQRILGAQGHLSNEDAARFAAVLAQSGASEIILAHLSRENNTPAMAQTAVERALSVAGVSPLLSVAPRDCLGPAHTVSRRSVCRR